MYKKRLCEVNVVNVFCGPKASEACCFSSIAVNVNFNTIYSVVEFSLGRFISLLECQRGPSVAAIASADRQRRRTDGRETHEHFLSRRRLRVDNATQKLYLQYEIIRM